MPVYYGDWRLYQPTVGSLRQCFETRCTVTIDSSILLRVPFQANTSDIILTVMTDRCDSHS